MAALGSATPKPENVYIVPTAFLSCLKSISKTLEGSGVKWSVIGDTAENIHGVNARPERLELLVDEHGIEQFSSRMAEYGISTFDPVEKKLERTASVDGKEFPVYVRSLFARVMLDGVEVNAHSDYRIKVGEWEWGDRLEFEPVEMNLVGELVPIMPVRIASEIYLMLGWTDRANKISDAVHRAHHRLDFGF